MVLIRHPLQISPINYSSPDADGPRCYTHEFYPESIYACPKSSSYEVKDDPSRNDARYGGGPSDLDDAEDFDHFEDADMEIGDEERDESSSTLLLPSLHRHLWIVHSDIASDGGFLDPNPNLRLQITYCPEVMDSIRDKTMHNIDKNLRKYFHTWMV